MTKITPGSTIGIIGGGQLGRMSALAAANLGIKVHIYSDQEDSPASHVAKKTTIGSYNDIEALKDFAKDVDLVTFEFENISYEGIKSLEQLVEVRPRAEALYLTQNRLREKEFLESIGEKVAPYTKIENIDDLIAATNNISREGILKTTEMGYDGKGQAAIKSDSELEEIWNNFASNIAVFEEKITFVKEISVVIARSIDGNISPYMPSENIHKDGILDTTIAPANISDDVVNNAWAIAANIIDKMDLVGILAVEMFLKEDGELLVNELAARPHNSGHWTMDACLTSQFEQFIRAVCGMPLGVADYHCDSVMKNLIGDDINTWKELVSDPNVKIHLYGKKDSRPGRKMGHYTKLITE